MRAWPLGVVARPWLIFLVGRTWLCSGLFFVSRPASLARRRLVDLRLSQRRRRFECFEWDRSPVPPSCLTRDCAGSAVVIDQTDQLRRVPAVY